MKNSSQIVLSRIDKIMTDCARGNFNDDFAIQKINTVIEAYTVYKKCLAKVNDAKDRAARLRMELGEVERDFDAACHERDDAIASLDAMLDDL